MAIADTLTTREAVRRAALDDIVGRCQIAAVAIEGGALDGIEVVTLGTLRDQVSAALLVDLPTPSERFAEVVTPATITVSTICPECHLPAGIIVKLSPQLTVTNDGSELAVKAKSKARAHVCGQLSLPVDETQAEFGLGDIVGEIPTGSAIAAALENLPAGSLPAGVAIVFPDTYDGWSDLEKREVLEWAVAAHEHESDESIEVPPLPVVLGGTDPDGEADGGVAAEPDPDAPAGDGQAALELGDQIAETLPGVNEVLAGVAVDEARAEVDEIDTSVKCVGSNHVPGCEHFPDAPKKGATDDPPTDLTDLPF